MSNNLFDRHPPFQIDGNFGYTAGVVEMLLQSHEDGIIRVLPALPKAWESGSVKGLKAKGGLTVSLFWSNHQLNQVTIEAKNDIKFDLVYLDDIIPVSIGKGEEFVYKPN